LKKFVFRLATVLNMTETQKAEASALYALQLRKLREAEAELARLREEKRQIETALKDFSSHPSFPLDKHALYVAYLPVLKEKITAQEAVVKERSREAEIARQLLAKIAQEVKTLEKLQEKELEAYMIELLHEEQKQLDDTAGVSFFQKTKN
jgi:flagellar export protein FliJ